MKRLDLIKAIEASGCVLVRHGGRHDWYRNPVTGVSQPVPRIARSRSLLRGE
jgi:predicted RNA binding protein YcfA (HicA-like mRNA interferase family)